MSAHTWDDGKTNRSFHEQRQAVEHGHSNRQGLLAGDENNCPLHTIVTCEALADACALACAATLWPA